MAVVLDTWSDSFAQTSLLLLPDLGLRTRIRHGPGAAHKGGITWVAVKSVDPHRDVLELVDAPPPPRKKKSDAVLHRPTTPPS